jgi:hypothetical protein
VALAHRPAGRPDGRGFARAPPAHPPPSRVLSRVEPACPCVFVSLGCFALETVYSREVGSIMPVTVNDLLNLLNDTVVHSADFGHSTAIKPGLSTCLVCESLVRFVALRGLSVGGAGSYFCASRSSRAHCAGNSSSKNREEFQHGALFMKAAPRKTYSNGFAWFGPLPPTPTSSRPPRQPQPHQRGRRHTAQLQPHFLRPSLSQSAVPARTLWPLARL